MRLILASQSPRRRELLRNAGYDFEIRNVEVPERRLPRESAEAYVERLATGKAQAAKPSLGEVAIGADTVVVVDGQVLEKPLDRSDASRMLALLSGRRHRVLTGICVYDGHRTLAEVESTWVEFDPMQPGEIEEYVASGEPMDKAGAYAIQGRASRYVAGIEGCYFNVVGLPVRRLSRLLQEIASKTPA